VTILPDSTGSATHPHLAIATGKTGVLYLLDQTNLGQFNSGADNDVQEVAIQTLNTTVFGAGVFGNAVYWNGNVYVAMVRDSLLPFAGIAFDLRKFIFRTRVRLSRSQSVHFRQRGIRGNRLGSGCWRISSLCAGCALRV
jgi:hypothetical protein